MELAEHIRAYLEVLQVEQMSSPHTIQAYRRDLRYFAEYMGDKYLERSRIAGFPGNLLARGLAAKSVSRAASAVKTFLKFLCREQIVEEDHSRAIVPLKAPRRLPAVLGSDQVARVFDSLRGAKGVTFRDLAVVELLYASGLRASELARLRLGDVDFQVPYVRAQGKGDKERVVPMGVRAARAVADYLREERPRYGGAGRSEYVFLGRKGRRIARETVWRTVKKCAKVAGQGASLWPHLFRHCFATHLLENGTDLRFVQDLLGHATIATTEIYTHVDRTKLKDVRARFHPRA